MPVIATAAAVAKGVSIMAKGKIFSKIGGFVKKMSPKVKGFVKKTGGVFKKIGGWVSNIRERRQAKVSGTVTYSDDSVTGTLSTNNTAAAYAQYLPWVAAAIGLYLIIKK